MEDGTHCQPDPRTGHLNLGCSPLFQSHPTPSTTRACWLLPQNFSSVHLLRLISVIFRQDNCNEFTEPPASHPPHPPAPFRQPSPRSSRGIFLKVNLPLTFLYSESLAPHCPCNEISAPYHRLKDLQELPLPGHISLRSLPSPRVDPSLAVLSVSKCFISLLP